MARLSEFLTTQLARVFSRPKEETRALEQAAPIRIKLGAFAALLMAGLSVFAPALYVTWRAWSTPLQYVRPDGGEWRVLYEAPQRIDEVRRVPNTLFEAPYRDGYAPGSKHGDWLRQHSSTAFWLGTIFKQDALRQARSDYKHVFALGSVGGEARVFVNDLLLYEWRGSEKPKGRILLSIPLNLFDAKELRVAVWLKTARISTYPDRFNAAYGGEGLISEREKADHIAFRYFLSYVRPFSLFFGNTLLAIGFIFFWISSKRKQEYFFLGIFALCESFLQLKLFSPVIEFYQTSVWNEILSYSLHFLSGYFALLFAASFCRIPRKTLVGIATVTGLTGLGLLLVKIDNTRLFYLTDATARIWIPGAALLGATLCGIQAWVIARDPAKKGFLVMRRRRLLLVAIGLVCIALLNYWASLSYSDPKNYVFFNRYAYFLVVLFVVRIVFSDYREAETIIRHSLVTPFHETALINRPVVAAVVYLDLKRSENLILAGAARGDSKKYLSAAMSLISDEITKLGGYIISRIEGDMIRAIFPDGPSGGGAERCLAALVGSQHALDGFQASMLTIQDKSVQKYFAEALAFRAGVAYGKVVPAFDSSGPTWLHADETTPLLDSVRLAEGEPTFGIRETLILMQESIARDVPGDIEWLSKGERELSAKHGRTSRPWVATIAKKTYSIPNAA